MIISYHNHTTWSDGVTTIADQIEGARRCNIDELGISDHYVLSPETRHVGWSMPVHRLDEYVEELRAAALHSQHPTVRIGLEADFFPETVENLRNCLASYSFDYVIGSVHFIDDFPIDAEKKFWDMLSEQDRNNKWSLYWERLREMAESRVYDIVGHLDLPKKFGYRPTVDLRSEIDSALDAIAECEMTIELNTAGWFLAPKEPYPSLELLRAARMRQIPLVISADAHTPKHLVRNFDLAQSLAREAGYRELVRYAKRKRYPVPF